MRIALLVPLFCSCAATALYGSPRPLRPGQFQTTLLFETSADTAPLAASKSRPYSFVASPIPAPGVEMRVGLATGVDMGARASIANGFQVDTKIALAEGPRYALSLDPAVGGGTYIYSPFGAAGQAALRLLAGYRIDPDVELIGHVTEGLVLLEHPQSDPPLTGTSGVGFSILIRTSQSFALQPSVTSLWRRSAGWGLIGSGPVLWTPEVTFGLGLVFGEGA